MSSSTYIKDATVFPTESRISWKDEYDQIILNEYIPKEYKTDVEMFDAIANILRKKFPNLPFTGRRVSARYFSLEKERKNSVKGKSLIEIELRIKGVTIVRLEKYVNSISILNLF
jgi:hypothetical protein